MDNSKIILLSLVIFAKQWFFTVTESNTKAWKAWASISLLVGVSQRISFSFGEVLTTRWEELI